MKEEPLTELLKSLETKADYIIEELRAIKRQIASLTDRKVETVQKMKSHDSEPRFVAHPDLDLTITEPHSGLQHRFKFYIVISAKEKPFCPILLDRDSVHTLLREFCLQRKERLLTGSPYDAVKDFGKFLRERGYLEKGTSVDLGVEYWVGKVSQGTQLARNDCRLFKVHWGGNNET